jgi:NAD(P)-dependent dehydrogenase (short-subunit alcohol dehydrogenase family)
VEHWSGVLPLGHIASAEDIAHAVRFLCSYAARQITGQTLIVDGGWTDISPTPGLDFVQGKKPIE